ncbi:histidine phosphatase family protein [Phycobacter azelaicus]|uniref:histidine phosphatase family protein n=1 Tax=Phycobacter azelaicus TaxID=2668075 RepID=UPI001868883D|nr:histidine phosphatase family protein [Phycobacter azelaicus]MBE1295407.1 histidine phosphatase family protein [Paracoccaceae bacterium]
MIRLLVIFLALPMMAAANDWDALKAPGAMAIMRHALAPGTGDPGAFVLDDCSTQRNLDARGRKQAEQTGAALKAMGITFDAILTSQWCRTRETARLLDLGPVTDAPALNSFFQDFSTRDSQTREALDLLKEAEGSLMLVTHQVNISALTGRSTRSGEILVFRLTEAGEVEVTGSILIAP